MAWFYGYIAAVGTHSSKNGSTGGSIEKIERKNEMLVNFGGFNGPGQL